MPQERGASAFVVKDDSQCDSEPKRFVLGTGVKCVARSPDEPELLP